MPEEARARLWYLFRCMLMVFHWQAPLGDQTTETLSSVDKKENVLRLSLSISKTKSKETN